MNMHPAQGKHIHANVSYSYCYYFLFFNFGLSKQRFSSLHRANYNKRDLKYLWEPKSNRLMWPFLCYRITPTPDWQPTSSRNRSYPERHSSRERWTNWRFKPPPDGGFNPRNLTSRQRARGLGLIMTVYMWGNESHIVILLWLY